MVMLLTQGKSGSQIVPIHVYIEVAVFSGVVGQVILLAYNTICNNHCMANCALAYIYCLSPEGAKCPRG